MIKVKNSYLSELLINFGGGLAIGSTLLFWGGLFGLELPDAFSFGYVRIQDILCIIGVGIIILGILTCRKVPTKAVLYFLLFFGWVVYGVIVGILNNNTAINIGYEARVQIYALFGAIIGCIVSKKRIRSFLLIVASTLAFAILIQWILTFLGSDFTLVSGSNPGNIFTLNIPLVRPAGGFHTVGLGLLLVLISWTKSALLVSLLLAAAVVITQSKTYWILSAIVLFVGPLIKGRSRFFSLVRNGIIGILVVILALLIFDVAGLISNINVATLNKFTLIFSDPDVQYGVIGVRKVELEYVYSALKDNLSSIPFGHGLGYSYRDIGALFYRPTAAEQERLSLFIHNYPAWVLLKYGLVGLCVISVLLFHVYRGIRKGDIYQKQFGLVLFLMLLGSLVMGTFEDPASAFLFGLLVAVAGRPPLLEI